MNNVSEPCAWRYTKVHNVRVWFLFVSSSSMEIASSAISDLPRFVRRRDLLPDVNGGFGRLSLSRYGSADLASLDQSWIVSHGCREEVCPRIIYPGYYVFGNGDSFSRLPTTSTKWIGYLS